MGLFVFCFFYFFKHPKAEPISFGQGQNNWMPASGPVRTWRQRHRFLTLSVCYQRWVALSPMQPFALDDRKKNIAVIKCERTLSVITIQRDSPSGVISLSSVLIRSMLLLFASRSFWFSMYSLLIDCFAKNGETGLILVWRVMSNGFSPYNIVIWLTLLLMMYCHIQGTFDIEFVSCPDVRFEITIRWSKLYWTELMRHDK